MNWTPIYAALANAAALTGIPSTSIDWKDQPQASSWTFGAKLTMQIKNDRAVGIDYEEFAAPVGAANQVTTVVGQRQFMWEIRCEIQNSDPATVSIAYLDLLRTRLQRTTTEQGILLPAGLAVVEINPTVQLPSIASSRATSTYVLDVLMACAENDVDTSPTAGAYVASVGIASNQLLNPDGTVAAQQITETVGP